MQRLYHQLIPSPRICAPKSNTLRYFEWVAQFESETIPGIADELLLPREGTGIRFEAHWISDAGDALSYSR